MRKILGALILIASTSSFASECFLYLKPTLDDQSSVLNTYSAIQVLAREMRSLGVTVVKDENFAKIVLTVEYTDSLIITSKNALGAVVNIDFVPGILTRTFINGKALKRRDFDFDDMKQNAERILNDAECL